MTLYYYFEQEGSINDFNKETMERATEYSKSKQGYILERIKEKLKVRFNKHKTNLYILT